MIPHKTENIKAICDNYENALASLKETLYNSEYYTLAESSVYIAYNRRIHRYYVLTRRDNTIPLNENPRAGEYYDTIRITEIPTSSDDFDEYIRAQLELTRLNNNLSNRITSDNVEEEEESVETRKAIISSIIYIQNPRVADKEAAHFEYDQGNSEIAKRCNARITEKDDEGTKLTQQPSKLQENIEHILSDCDIPTEIAKELAMLTLADRIATSSPN